MKAMITVTAVILSVGLFLAGGTVLANDKKAELDSEANARGIEKSDIKRGMPIAKPKPQQAGDPIPDIDITVSQAEKNLKDDTTKRAGDPIPGIDITVNQGKGVCQENCDQQTDAVKKGGSKFKAGKALADTVKKVDDGNDDVDHVDEDSDDDGLLDQ